MTDEEAFIRVIANAAGDDAPRLVYADWLDDRGDPRGAFLRLECETFRQTPELFQSGKWLAKAHYTIDPLWVARVSRAPVGVCCDHLHWHTDIPPGPPLTPADLDAFERRFTVSLPRSYRAFLLNWNGGYPYPGDFYLPDDDEGAPAIRIESFGMILPPGRAVSTSRSPGEIGGPVERIQRGDGPILAIASNASDGVLFLGITGTAAGSIYWHGDWTHASDDPEMLIEVAGSLGHFLASLQTHEPEALQAIIRNEPARLVRCLDEGFDVNWTDPESEWGLLDMAAIYHRRECVRILVQRGVRATDATPHAARECGDPEIIALLPFSQRHRNR